MLRPETEAQVADAVRAANGPLSVRGGGTRGVAAMGEVLTTEALAGIVRYEPGALTLIAKADIQFHEVILIACGGENFVQIWTWLCSQMLLTYSRLENFDEVHAALAAKGQRLAFEPMDHRALLGTRGTPTLGGMVAANVSGPRRIQAGACRDSLLGVRFVDGHGAVVANGGRVMKNVTGYDLVKLMAGSFGTLGVLTEVAFKVLPTPEAAATLWLDDLDLAGAVGALGQALGSPHEVTAAAWGGGRALIRVEGFAASVEERTAALVALWSPLGPVRTERDPEAQAALWQDIRDVRAFADRPGDVWRVSVKPTDATTVLDRVPHLDAQADWGGGLLWLRVAAGQHVRPGLAGIGGHATRARGASHPDEAVPAFHPEPPAIARLTAGLRAQFDPRGVLNPGVMG